MLENLASVEKVTASPVLPVEAVHLSNAVTPMGSVNPAGK